MNVPWIRVGHVALSLFSIAYAGGWLLYRSSATDPVRERMFCRFGICETDAALRAIQAGYGGAIRSVPHTILVEYLRRDPAGPNRWCDLGEALHRTGHEVEARHCFARAIELAPGVPYILFRTARFQLARGEIAEALGLMARAMQGDTSWSAPVFAEYETNEIPVDLIFQYGLPNAEIGRAFFRRVIAGMPSALPDAAWQRMLAAKWVDDAVAVEYVNTLIQTNDYDDSIQAWAAYAGGCCPDYRRSNYIFNGDFELALISSPFDWRLDPPAGATVTIDRTVAYSGLQSARIQLHGTENVELSTPSQAMVLPPGRYKLAAYVKTDGVTTDQGISFAISMSTGSVMTENLTGTMDWELVERQFDVPEDAGLIQVRVVRRPSAKFANRVMGTAWVDQMSISRLNGA